VIHCRATGPSHLVEHAEVIFAGMGELHWDATQERNNGWNVDEEGEHGVNVNKSGTYIPLATRVEPSK
jgi:hypothetical protein